MATDTVNELNALAVDTARKHPMMMAAWLALDGAINALMGVQVTVEDKLRDAAGLAYRVEEGAAPSNCSPS